MRIGADGRAAEMALDYRLRVDWDGDDTFGNSLADVTADITHPIVAKRGREYASQVYGLSVAGRLMAILRNDNERYSNLSQQSTLRGLVLPRRKIEFAAREDAAADWTPLWTGYVEHVEPVERRSGRDEVELYALGILSELTDRLVTWALHISSRVGKRIYQSVVQGGRDFPYIRVGGGQ